MYVSKQTGHTVYHIREAGIRRNSQNKLFIRSSFLVIKETYINLHGTTM